MKLIMVIILNLFAFLTIKLRPKLFNVKLFKPMIWNFKLSILPAIILLVDLAIFLAFRAIFGMRGNIFLDIISVIVLIIGFMLWLLVLPNSSYLITELNLTHRSQDEVEVPLWYDIVSVMAFALSGILNTVININIIQYTYIIALDPDVIRAQDKLFFYVSAIIINILISVGVYLGRYIRFNSWDVLKPISFIKMILSHFKEKGMIKNFILFVLFHSLFFIIIYFLFNADSILFR